MAELTHLALFLHGLLAHSSTSTSQLPLADPLLSITEHCAVYCVMNPGTQAPLAKPASQLHLYALTEMFTFVAAHAQQACIALTPFALTKYAAKAHGTFPGVAGPHFAHELPFASFHPTKSLHLCAFMEILLFEVESTHAALFLHGLLAHSSTSTSQLPPP